MKKILLFIFTFSSFVYASDSTKAAFTQDEFNLVITYFQRGTIPALSDSVTLLSVQTLKAKLDAVLTKKTALKNFTMNENEKKLIAHFMRDDLNTARTLISLQQKLSSQATNGKAK